MVSSISNWESTAHKQCQYIKLCWGVLSSHKRFEIQSPSRFQPVGTVDHWVWWLSLLHPMLHFDVACNTLWQADLLTKTKGEQWSFFGSDGMVISFWVTQPSPLTDFQPPDHCFQWFFDGFGVIQPLVSMVFNGYGPFVQQCDGFNGSFTSKLSQNLKF